MDASSRPATLGALKAAGTQLRSLRDELRTNLVAALAEGRELFPGIVGYEDTVLPQLENALLSGQDIILLGERGQAKSRLIRALTDLLDEWTPVIADVAVPENPYEPFTAEARQKVEALGDETPIRWLHRSERYGEKLATPDITIADLIGEVDPIKLAEGRHLSDETSLHYGLLPRSNRGVFAINELPDLAERIQVGLLNALEERDVQIRGHKIRLPLDMLIVATANPEDYTNRGRIITPLKDRYGAQIRTHYPQTLAHEIRIMEQEAAPMELGEHRITVPDYMKEILAQITHLARKSPDISQRSGVSVRASVSSYETLVANALRRAVRLSEQEAVPRISDLPFVLPSLQGKVEFETFEDGQELEILQKLVNGAVEKVFAQRFDPADLEAVADAFEGDVSAETGEAVPARHYVELLERLPTLRAAVDTIAPESSSACAAAATELVLEGLHLNRMLNKDLVDGRAVYQE
jgi:magnesium chelatase subunit I